MQPLTDPAPQSAETCGASLEPLLHHLAHELRQPLSGIESVAYYLDMVVSAARPDLIPHCRRLRSMVQQAHWLLDDAALSLQLSAAKVETMSVQAEFARIAGRLVASENAILDVHAAGPLPPVTGPGVLPRLLDHVIAFFRDVAGCPDPIGVQLEAQPPFLRVVVEAACGEEAQDVVRLFDPPPPGSSARRYFEAAGGGMRVDAAPSWLAVTMLLPLKAQQPA